MSIQKNDIYDVDFMDASELSSSGSASDEYRTATVDSVALGVITVSGVNLYHPDYPLESGDIVVISGSTAADGSYFINSITSSTTFTVNESISDSTGGTASFRYPSGASKVGVDPTDISQSSNTDLQTVLEDLDSAISGGGLTAAQHRSLRQLIHFIDNGPAEGFVSGAYRETVGGVFPTSVIWYDDNTKVKKLVEKLITWDGAFPSTIVWKMYDTDGSSVLSETSDSYDYTTSIFEPKVTRTITVY